MAGTTRLELATSGVTDALSCAGLRRINRLDVRLSATVGFVGQGWLAFVQRFVQPLAISLDKPTPRRAYGDFSSWPGDRECLLPRDPRNIVTCPLFMSFISNTL